MDETPAVVFPKIIIMNKKKKNLDVLLSEELKQSLGEGVDLVIESKRKSKEEKKKEQLKAEKKKLKEERKGKRAMKREEIAVSFVL